MKEWPSLDEQIAFVDELAEHPDSRERDLADDTWMLRCISEELYRLKDLVES